MPNDTHKYVRGWLNVHETKKKQTKRNIRHISTAGTLESFYMDGVVGASLHCTNLHLWEILWSLLHLRYLGPRKTSGRGLRFTRCWLAKVEWDVEPSRHRFSSCSRQLPPHKQTHKPELPQLPPYLPSSLLLFPYFPSILMMLPRSPIRTCIFVLDVVPLTKCQSKSPKIILLH